MRDTQYESREHQTLIALLAEVVRDGFLTMPNLCVTETQAKQLWSLKAHTSAAVLDRLCAEGFLIRTGEGVYKRP